MKNESETNNKYFEVLTQNRQKGEIYRLKFKNNPTIYETIPFITLASKNDYVFKFKVLQPEKFRGIYQKSVEDIELLVKS